MREREHFEASMNALRKEVGQQAYRELYLIYAEVTEWLISDGWGDITLSAFKHRFNKKFRANAVKEVKSLHYIH